MRAGGLALRAAACHHRQRSPGLRRPRRRARPPAPARSPPRRGRAGSPPRARAPASAAASCRASRRPASATPDSAPDEALARGPEQRPGSRARPAAAGGRISARLCAMRLAEADAGIERDARRAGCPAPRPRPAGRARKPRHLQRDVVVGGCVLHGARVVAAHVHQDQPARRQRATTRGASGSWRSAETSLTISRPGLQRRRAWSRRCACRSMTGAALAQFADHRQDAARISSSGGTGAAPGRVRFAADVEDVGAGLQHGVALRRSRPARRGAARHREKLSGVTLTTPITSGRRSGRRGRRRARRGCGQRRAARSCQASGTSASGSDAAVAAGPIRRTEGKAAGPPCSGRARPAAMAAAAAAARCTQAERLDPASAACRHPAMAKAGTTAPRSRSRAQARPQRGGPGPGRVAAAAPGSAAASGGRELGTLPRPAGTGSSGRLRTTGSPRITLLDLVARQRLVLQQALGQQVQLVDVLGQDRLRALA